ILNAGLPSNVFATSESIGRDDAGPRDVHIDVLDRPTVNDVQPDRRRNARVRGFATKSRKDIARLGLVSPVLQLRIEHDVRSAGRRRHASTSAATATAEPASPETAAARSTAPELIRAREVLGETETDRIG